MIVVNNFVFYSQNMVWGGAHFFYNPYKPSYASIKYKIIKKNP